MKMASSNNNNNMNMLAMVFASWQRPDGTFAPVEPIYRMVWGPPGCSIVLHVAWRRHSPDGRFLHYEGFARVYRIFNTGGRRDYRLFNFEARPCALCGRMHWDCDVGFRGGDDGEGRRFGGGGRDVCPFDVGEGGGDGGGGDENDQAGIGERRGAYGGGGGARGEEEEEDTADSACSTAAGGGGDNNNNS